MIENLTSPAGGLAKVATPALQALFAPRQVAIYADFSGPDRYGWRLVETLQRHGYAGQIWPVSPRNTHISGLALTPALPAEARPEAVVIALPVEATLQAIDECGRQGVQVAVVATIGFAESGPAGAAQQTRLVEHARAAGVRVLGPNCLGAINTRNGVTLANSLALLQAPLHTGQLSLVSHSGSLLGSILGYGQAQGLGFRYLAATGNEADLTLEDILDFALEDEGTQAVALVVEHLRRPERFIELADRAAQLGKPLVALKLGRSTAAARIAQTHTAALVGDDAAYSALFNRYGITRVRSPEALVTIAATLMRTPRPAGRRVAILASSGGVCGLLADLAAEADLELASLAQPPSEALQRLYGERLDNPLDFGRTLPHLAPKAPSLMRQLAEALAQHPGVDVVLFGLSAMPNLADNVRQLLAGLNQAPLVVYDSAQGAWADDAKAELRAQGQMLIAEAGLAVEATQASIDYAEFLHTYRSPRPIQPAAIQATAGVLTDPASRALLAAAGLGLTPARLAQAVEEAVAQAEGIGFPVALKVISPTIVHKSVAGAVQLSLATTDAVRAGYAELMARVRARAPEATIEGVLVQPMVEGVEVLLGSYTDPQWGPIIVLGRGGRWAEIAHEKVYGWPPLTLAEAGAMIRRWPGFEVWPNQPPADVEALAQLIMAFSEAVVALKHWVLSVDLNPVIVGPRGQGLFLADVRVEVA